MSKSSIMTIANNAILYIWNVLREYILKVIITGKNICDVMNVNQTLW